MKVKLVTEHGWEFWAESFVDIGGDVVAMDALTPEQHDYIMASVDAHALTAAARGTGAYRAELPPFEQVFPERKRIKRGAI